MSTDILIERVMSDKKAGLLDYNWLIRLYLSKNDELLKDMIIDGDNETFPKKHSFLFLLNEAISPFVYVWSHKNEIEKDISLKSVIQLCTNPQLVYDVDFKDIKLNYLSHLFNKLVDSDRILLMCYDCGTVARGVFFQLINAHRGEFLLKKNEIKRIKDDYYMDKYPVDIALDVFKITTSTIKKNCLYMCALQLGDKFGHIYVIEKTYIDKKPRYRIYQSCHRSYMLIDYIEYMDYADHPEKGININEHINDLYQIMTTDKWKQKEIDLFVKWFHFYPMGRIMGSDIKRFSSTYVIY